MGTKERNFRSLPEDISLEELVPKDNFYRRLAAPVLNVRLGSRIFQHAGWFLVHLKKGTAIYSLMCPERGPPRIASWERVR